MAPHRTSRLRMPRPAIDFARGDLRGAIACILHKPDLLIFLHIGKTGGTTLSDVLVRNFPGSSKVQRLVD